MTREREIVNIKCSWCRKKDTVKEVLEKDKKRVLCLEYRTRKKQPWQNQRIMALLDCK